MDGKRSALKNIIAGGLTLVGVLMAGAMIDSSGVSGTCMFILVPYFAAIAAVYPVLAVNRFGTGILVYLPYALIGFFPLYYFDWLQSGALVGLWAVFVWSATGPLIGACLDLTMALTSRLNKATRAITAGAVMQAATFFMILLGFTFLYHPTAAGAGHLHFFNREWFFTLPWMAVNGAFGGYTAYSLISRSHAKESVPAGKTAGAAQYS